MLSMVIVNGVYAEENITDETNISAGVDLNIDDNVEDVQNESDFDSIQKLIDESSPGDSIYLENKTYVGNGTPITISKNISIYGFKSQNTVLDGNDKSNIFVVSKNVNVNIIGIDFVHGFKDNEYGGAITNDGKLTIFNSTFSHNQAFGGSISSSSGSQLTVYNTVFKDNKASNGAGIYNYQGKLAIYNSTFIFNDCNEGAGIYNLYAPCLIYNSTFMNNTAVRGGGVYNNKGNMKIYNSTFCYNYVEHLGGGIKSFGDCEVHDSLIKNNTAFQGGGLFVSQNTMKVDNCLVEDNIACEGAGFFADVRATLNIKNTRIINNSATIDGGGINVYQGYLTLSDSTLINNTAVGFGGGLFYSDYPYYSNIKNLIFINNSAKLGGGIYVGTLTVKITNASLIGNAAENGGGIYNAGNLSLDKIKLTSNTAENGAAIYSTSELSATDSNADNNKALNYGGAIYNVANLSINSFNFTSNEASSGGVIYNDAKIIIFNSIFSRNKASYAGAIFSYGDLVIDNAQFRNNQITNTYGDLFLISGNVNILNSIFDSSRGSDEGGAISNFANLYVNSSQFISNTAKSHGAGIDNNANLTVENSLFYNNKAYGAGAIDNGGNLIIINSNFTNNRATTNGGAIDNKGNMAVIGSIFENNSAKGNGGAIIARRGMSVNYSILYNNSDANGFSIYNSTWDEINVSNNWWGNNSPVFNGLFNFNVSGDFKWIKMSFTNSTPLIQDKLGYIIIRFDEGIVDVNLLPIFKIRLSNGNVLDVTNGFLLKSVLMPSVSLISCQMNGQKITLNVVINVDKIKRIIGNKNIVEDYKGKTTFKVRVIGDNLKPVGKNVIIVMKISGKSYNVKTDANGYASKTFSLTPGKYSVTVTYKGYSVKNTITVKNVLKAKSITKKKAKKIKYSASLKSSKGKVITGKKITFKIKGKTYWAKTNKKGIANVKFKNLKVGKYKITVKYLNSQVKTTLKVKK